MHYLTFLLAVYLLPAAPQTVSVAVSSTTDGGRIYLAVYDSEAGFTNDDFISKASREVRTTERRTELDVRIPTAGTYVFAAFQDLNGNGQLDTNFWGIPTEPYGFGELPPSKWRAPDFGEIATLMEGQDQVRIEVRHWRDY